MFRLFGLLSVLKSWTHEASGRGPKIFKGYERFKFDKGRSPNLDTVCAVDFSPLAALKFDDGDVRVNMPSSHLSLHPRGHPLVISPDVDVVLKLEHNEHTRLQQVLPGAASVALRTVHLSDCYAPLLAR